MIYTPTLPPPYPISPIFAFLTISGCPHPPNITPTILPLTLFSHLPCITPPPLPLPPASHFRFFKTIYGRFFAYISVSFYICTYIINDEYCYYNITSRILS